VVSQHGERVVLANGIVLGPDEETLYVTNGAVDWRSTFGPMAR
jgi:hypothetical protein